MGLKTGGKHRDTKGLSYFQDFCKIACPIGNLVERPPEEGRENKDFRFIFSKRNKSIGFSAKKCQLFYFLGD